MQSKRHTPRPKFAIGYGILICVCLVLTACNDFTHVRVIVESAEQHGLDELVVANASARAILKNKVESSSSGELSQPTESKDCDDVELLEKPKRLTSIVSTTQDNIRLRPGHITTAFELPNLEGEWIALYDVLDDNDYVLVDFWTSWCGPCIEEFSKLKGLYSTYNDHGFEIVSVSLDEQSEDWEEMSRTQSMPWISLADNAGFHGPTPTTYSVEGIPRKYLVDKHGCILHTDISNSDLEAFLDSVYGDKERLESSEPEVLELPIE